MFHCIFLCILFVSWSFCFCALSYHVCSYHMFMPHILFFDQKTKILLKQIISFIMYEFITLMCEWHMSLVGYIYSISKNLITNLFECVYQKLSHKEEEGIYLECKTNKDYVCVRPKHLLPLSMDLLGYKRHVCIFIFNLLMIT